MLILHFRFLYWIWSKWKLKDFKNNFEFKYLSLDENEQKIRQQETNFFFQIYLVHLISNWGVLKGIFMVVVAAMQWNNWNFCRLLFYQLFSFLIEPLNMWRQHLFHLVDFCKRLWMINMNFCSSSYQYIYVGSTRANTGWVMIRITQIDIIQMKIFPIRIIAKK